MIQGGFWTDNSKGLPNKLFKKTSSYFQMSWNWTQGHTKFQKKKYLDAKFRGCFSQVQLANQKFGDRTVVFIDTHNKLQKV